MNRTTSKRLIARSVLAAVVLAANLGALLVSPASAHAASNIVLDGKFADWQGQMYITDPAGDAKEDWGDIVAFYWANNPNDNTCYWMLQRASSTHPAHYTVHIDANNNGQYDDHVDRRVGVYYNPTPHGSHVTVTVSYADTGKKISQVSNKDWGESDSEGGSKVEFAASFADLGFHIGQTIRMYATSGVGGDGEGDNKESDKEIVDRVPDSGDVQWSPLPILGYPILAAILVLGVVAIWYFKGRHEWPSRR